MYVKQVLIAVDQTCNALLGGWADETLSSRSFRLQHKNVVWKLARIVIDSLFFWEENHCEESYASEIMRAQLPPEFRS